MEAFKDFVGRTSYGELLVLAVSINGIGICLVLLLAMLIEKLSRRRGK